MVLEFPWTNGGVETPGNSNEQIGSRTVDGGAKVEKDDPWNSWPPLEKSRIERLSNRPCMDYRMGIEPGDRRWRKNIVRDVENGSISLPSGYRDRKDIHRASDRVMHRCYHAARMVQNHFDNPVHGNYKDPLMEAIYIMLSWRGRISKAGEILASIVEEFDGPRQLLEDSSLPRFKELVSKAGLVKKRSDAIINLIGSFIERFPDGNTGEMMGWDDEDILDFLTGIPCIDRKSALCIMMYSLGRDRFPIDTHVGRILKRTGLLRELVTIDEDMEHRAVQQKAEFAVPPTVRRPLHAGLVSLGQKYCHPRTPSCRKCPLRNVCQQHAKNLQREVEGKPFTHIDLFCGAGGFSVGFRDEDFRTILAVDKDEKACQTYRLNHPEVPEGNIQCEDLSERSPAEIIDKCDCWREELRPGGVDVLTAGIPCQGFSKAGYRSRPGIDYNPLEDPRNKLYRVVIEWIREIRPRYVVIENVPEIRSAGNEDFRFFDALCNDIEKHDYKVDHAVINAFDHSVPQIRHRMIVIASHSSVPEIGLSELDEFSKEGPTLGQAIQDLPSLDASEGEWYRRYGEVVLTSHVARFNNEQDLKIYEAIRPGERYKDFIERDEGKEIIRERKATGRYAVYGTRSFSDKYHRLEEDRPSRTIVAHLNKDGNGYIHPNQVRSITPREAMRLQGFEDGYIFCGSQGSQFMQVGNAIPPPLARDVARLLAKHLKIMDRCLDKPAMTDIIGHGP
jgi:DNA (cytosine-5)-methyltransferase 1